MQWLFVGSALISVIAARVLKKDNKPKLFGGNIKPRLILIKGGKS